MYDPIHRFAITYFRTNAIIFPDGVYFFIRLIDIPYKGEYRKDIECLINLTLHLTSYIKIIHVSFLFLGIRGIV